MRQPFVRKLGLLTVFCCLLAPLAGRCDYVVEDGGYRIAVRVTPRLGAFDADLFKEARNEGCARRCVRGEDGVGGLPPAARQTNASAGLPVARRRTVGQRGGAVQHTRLGYPDDQIAGQGSGLQLRRAARPDHGPGAGRRNAAIVRVLPAGPDRQYTAAARGELLRCAGDPGVERGNAGQDQDQDAWQRRRAAQLQCAGGCTDRLAGDSFASGKGIRTRRSVTSKCRTRPKWACRRSPSSCRRSGWTHGATARPTPARCGRA